MNHASGFNNFRFVDFRFSRYHYTDSRGGAALHYLAYMLRGECRIVCDTHTLEIREGDVFYIPLGLRYQSYWYGNDEIRFISLGFRHLQTPEAENLILQTVPCADGVRERILAIRTGGAADSRSLAAFYGAMADILPAMVRTPQPRRETLIRRAEEWIAEHPACSMGELASACAVSESYLYVVFQRTLGETPNTFRQRVLCRRAEELLLSTDRTVEEIASALSFSSASYLRRVLKKHTGMTPRQIRRHRTF